MSPPAPIAQPREAPTTANAGAASPQQPLTPIQQSVLDHLRAYHRDNDNFPTTRQLARHFGWASQTAAMGQLRALAIKGHLERIHLPAAAPFYRFTR